MVVLPTPGTSSSRICPFARMAARTHSNVESLPTTAWRTWFKIRWDTPITMDSFSFICTASQNQEFSPL